MHKVNQTFSQDFILLGFTEAENYKLPLFLLFLLIYLLTLSGNMLIITLVHFQSFLHTPMYFFITNLSFLEMWYISTTVPKLLSIFATDDIHISFQSCFAQLYMFHGLGMTECALLAVMSLDRFMAICNPLRYRTVMHEKICRFLAALCWTYGFLAATIPLRFTLRVSFCGLRAINHFFCDLAPLLNLACTDTSTNRTVNGCVIGFATVFNFMFIIIMYVNIIWSILQLKTKSGRIKAFSTCSSHITVIVLIYGTAFTVYASPLGTHFVDYNKMFALVYAVLTPLLNPIIYSLRNKDVKLALEKVIENIIQAMQNRGWWKDQNILF